MPTQLKFEPAVRDRLFYDRFRYCLSFDLPEISCLRHHEFDPTVISQQLQGRRHWREVYSQGIGARHSRAWRPITPQIEQDLAGLAQLLKSAKDSFKLVVSVDHGRVYSNSQSLLDQLSQLPQLINCTCSESVIDRPRDSVKLQDSQFQFRSYFRANCIAENQKQNLINFLTVQQNHVRISPALAEWIKQPGQWFRDYFFVDHDSMTWLTMLALVCPGSIRKTMHIISDK
jgi:hypothetical protein